MLLPVQTQLDRTLHNTAVADARLAGHANKKGHMGHDHIFQLVLEDWRQFLAKAQQQGSAQSVAGMLCPCNTGSHCQLGALLQQLPPGFKGPACAVQHSKH
jgi:hypothetical protein